MDMNFSEMVDGWVYVTHGNGKEPTTRQEGDRARDDQGATRVSGQAPRLGAHTCSTSSPEQSRIPHQGNTERTSDNSRQYLSHSSVQPSPPHNQMRQGSEAGRLSSSHSSKLVSALDEQTWTCFYDFFKKYSSPFTRKYTTDDVKNALLSAMNEKRVSLNTVESMSDITTLTDVQKKALDEVTTQCIFLKLPNSSSKAVTSTDRSASSRTSNQVPVVRQKTRIKAPVNTGALSSNNLAAQRHAQGTRAKVSEPVDPSRSARPQQPLNTAVRYNATLARQANLSKTSAFTSSSTVNGRHTSAHSSPLGGAAGSFAQQRPLLPEPHGSRHIMAAVIPSNSNSNATREKSRQSQQAAVADSSTSRLSPPALRKQEEPLFPRDSFFRPIKAQAEVATTTTLAQGLNVQKAPESSGARPKYSQPVLGSGLVCPKPVSPARKEAVPARSTGTLSQPVTQTILEPDSVHLGNATEEQISKIVRNLKFLDSTLDEATCSGIKESINSMGLDKVTIEQAAGGTWREETKDALDRVRMEYAIQKLSPPSTPSVGAGLASDTDRTAGVFKSITPVPVVVQKKRMVLPAAHNTAEANIPASRQVPSAIQPVKSVKQRDKTDRAHSDDNQQLRGMLRGLCIDPAKHDQIIALKLHSVKAGELLRRLMDDVRLNCKDARFIVENFNSSTGTESKIDHAFEILASSRGAVPRPEEPARLESRSRVGGVSGENEKPSTHHRITEQEFVRREENTATDDEVNDIIKALEKEYGRLDDEAISNIKKNIRFIKLSPVEIDNAAAGGRTLLDKILIECQTLESSAPPRASSPKAEQSPVTSTHFGGFVQDEDVIDGSGTAAGSLQGLQSSFYQDLLRTASNDVEADDPNNYEPVFVPDQLRPKDPYTGSQQLQQSRQAVGASELSQIELSTEVTPNGQPAAPLRGNRVIESMPLTAVFKDEIKLNYLIQHLKNYFTRNAQRILISRESLNRFLERHIGSISEKDFRAASAGAEYCVKDIARAYVKWQGNENAGSNRPVGLPALAQNPQAGLIPNDAGSVRRGYAPWNVGAFIMTPNIQTDGVVGLESTLSYEQARVQTLTPQTQFHQNAFRRQLQALLNNQGPAGGGLLDTEGMTPSLMADLQGGNVENFSQIEEQAIRELSTAQYPMAVHNDGRVVVQRAAGIQAEENNCAVAAVLMALSHQGNLGLLIEEGAQLINILYGQRHRPDLQLNQQLNRLIRLVEVLKEFNEVDPSVLRANDGLNEIRNIFGLTQGVILDSDEFLERIATMFRDLRPYANMRTNFDIFNLPGENMEEYAQMSIDEACRKFHLREVVREVGRENADSCALDAVCMTLDQSPSAKDAILFVQTLSANPMFVNGLTEELQRSVGRINALLPLLETPRERGEGHLKDFIPEIRRAYALEYTSIIYPSVLVEKIINDLNILVMLSSGQIRNLGEELIADCDNFYQRTLSSEVRRLNRTRSLKREPELVTNPDLFVVSTPSFGFQNRAKMEISPELTKTDSSGSIDRYRLDSVISITSGHYVAWMYDHQRKRLIAADSMSEKLGASAHEKVVVPAIVSMPMENTSNALKDAVDAMNKRFDSPVKDAKSRFEKLQSCFRLAFYRKI